MRACACTTLGDLDTVIDMLDVRVLVAPAETHAALAELTAWAETLDLA